MPRSVSGNYTLPLPPVVANTVIQAAWANTTNDDIAQAITDSLDRYGRGGLVAPFRIVDGIVTAPALAFAAETGTGLWRDGTGVLAISVLGSKVGQWSAAGLLAGDITALNGTIQDLSVTNILASTIDTDTLIATVGLTSPSISSLSGIFNALQVTGVSDLQGSVGIGMVLGPPASKLHIYAGDQNIESAYPGSGLTPASRGLTFLTRNSTSAFVAAATIQALWNRISDTDFGSSMLFYTAFDNTSVERMRIDSAGRLGVGRTPTPGYTVDVQGLVRTVGDSCGLRVVNAVGDGAGSFTTPIGAGSGIDISADAGAIRFSAGGALKAVINTSGWLSLGLPTAEQRNIQVRDSSGAQIILGNRTNSAANMIFGAVLFDAYRDVASPSLVAGMWAEGNAPLGNNTDLVFGVQANGTTSYPVERMRLYGVGTPGTLRIGPLGGAVTASALEVKGASNSIVVSGGAAGGYQGIRIYNDTYSSGRSLEIDYMGSAFGSAALSWGPTGEQASIATTNAFPLVLGASNTARLWIQSDGGQPIRASSNANWHALALDPGSNTGAIPIGAIIAGDAFGWPGGGGAPLSTQALSGGTTITMNAIPPAANVILTTGTYRLLSRVNSNYSIFIRTG